ncbi:hypothetical protein GGI35DRAFT_434509 [Trichoderma velutinum]
MDHLPQPQGGTGFRVEVHFLEDAQSAYRGGGLKGYHMQPLLTLANSHDLPTDQELSKFFQSWLFFGTLIEIFNVYDITILRDDFVGQNEKGHAIITTKCLPDYIAAWIIAASREYPGCLDSSKYYSTAREVGDIFGSVGGQAVASLIHAVRRDVTPIPSALTALHDRQEAWTKGREKAKAKAACIWKVLDAAATELRSLRLLSHRIDGAVWDSVLVLCTTLQTAAFFMYSSIPLEKPFTVPFNTIPARLTPQLFAENGWCPREKKIVSDLVDSDHCALLLCAQLDRHHGYDHSRCNAGSCEAYQVNPDTYQTRHYQVDCDCDFVGFDGFESEDPARNKLLKTIIRDQSWLSLSQPTPMATYHDRQLRLVPVSARQLLGGQFVAISHVWADGLGNSEANALPRCQLERIQHLVDKQFPDVKGPVPFWMDTLCIPVTKNKPEEYREAKKMAIKNMESVYKSSTKVLVLDRTLASLPSVGMSAEVIGLRIMCSGWARRLWTLQEGLYQARVYYQFADMTFTFEQLDEAVRKANAFPGRSVTVSETHFLRQKLANPPYCEASFEPLARFAHKALSCCWPRISSFFGELNIRHSQPDPQWFPGMQLVPGVTILVPRALRTIAYRTTSRREDEGLILAGLTNWRANSAENLTEVLEEERMRACFEQFVIVPSQLIFLDQQRYEDSGSRWIPKSLLAQSTEGTNPLPYEHAIISDEFSWPSPQGITAEYPSFRLTLPPGWSPSMGNQHVRLHLAGYIYKGFVHQAGLREAPVCLSSNLALIVPRSIFSGPWKCVAAVVSILPRSHAGSSRYKSGLSTWCRNALADYHDKSRVLGRHEALLDLERVPEEQGVDEKLPWVNTVPMTEYLTSENNTPWRIG